MSSPIEVSIRSFWPFCGRPMRSGARKMKPMRICRQMWSRSWRARPSGWKSTLALMMHPSMAHSSKMVSTLEKWDDWHWSTEFLIECNILVIHWCEWIRVEQLLWQFHFVPEALYRLAEVDSRVSHFEQLEFHSEDSWRGGKNRHSTTGIHFDSHHKQSHANATIHYSAPNTCTAHACLHDCVYTARLWRNVGILSCLLDADAMFAEEKVVKSTGTSRSVKEIDKA